MICGMLRRGFKLEKPCPCVDGGHIFFFLAIGSWERILPAADSSMFPVHPFILCLFLIVQKDWDVFGNPTNNIHISRTLTSKQHHLVVHSALVLDWNLLTWFNDGIWIQTRIKSTNLMMSAALLWDTFSSRYLAVPQCWSIVVMAPSLNATHRSDQFILGVGSH